MGRVIAGGADLVKGSQDQSDELRRSRRESFMAEPISRNGLSHIDANTIVETGTPFEDLEDMRTANRALGA